MDEICTNDPIIQWDKDKQKWKTYDAVCCIWNGKFITVPAGFYTDLATIPWPLVGVPGAARYGNHNRAAIIHDYVYGVKGHLDDVQMTRKEADDLFYDIMIEDEVPKWKAWTMWFAVRIAPNLWGKF